MIKKCFLCDSRIKVGKRIKINSKYSYKICGSCKGAVLNPSPPTKDLHKIYRDPSYFCSPLIKSCLIRFVIKRKLADLSFKWVDKNFMKGKILDVGCGNGDFLVKLKNLGWKIEGIDISPIAVKDTSMKIGSQYVTRGDLLKVSLPNKYSLVSFWHVLEHLNNPKEYIKKSKTLLVSGGSIVGEVPNIDSLWLRVFGVNYYWLSIPAHVFYFSEQSLREMLSKSGFVNIEISHLPRGLLIFSLSLNRYLSSKKTPLIICKTLLVLSTPFSIVLGIILSIIRRGEVIRFSAKNENHG